MSFDMCMEDMIEAVRSADTNRAKTATHSTEIEARPKQPQTGQQPVDIWAMDKHTREIYIAEHIEMFF